jgi:hypothetical protein
MADKTDRSRKSAGNQRLSGEVEAAMIVAKAMKNQVSSSK